MMASAHVARMGFMSRQVLAHPNSPKGLSSQRVIMVTAQITVMVPATAWIHMTGKLCEAGCGRQGDDSDEDRNHNGKDCEEVYGGNYGCENSVFDEADGFFFAFGWVDAYEEKQKACNLNGCNS